MMDTETLFLEEIEKTVMIGSGNTAEIYEYGSECVIKLFRDGFPKQGVLRELEIAKKIQGVCNLTPRAFKFVTYKNRYGILYEKVCGTDMFSLLGDKPFSLFGIGKKLAIIHKEIHDKDIDGILSVKEKLTQEIEYEENLTPDEKKEVVDFLDKMPDKNSLCHFDFHPGNIMVDDSGYRVIDWLTACVGDPAADVARTWLLLKYGEMRDADRKTKLLVSIVKAFIRGKYLRSVCKMSGISKKEVKKWIVPVATARLSEWLTERERDKLLKLIRKKL